MGLEKKKMDRDGRRKRWGWRWEEGTEERDKKRYQKGGRNQRRVQIGRDEKAEKAIGLKSQNKIKIRARGVLKESKSKNENNKIKRVEAKGQVRFDAAERMLCPLLRYINTAKRSPAMFESTCWKGCHRSPHSDNMWKNAIFLFYWIIYLSYFSNFFICLSH